MNPVSYTHLLLDVMMSGEDGFAVCRRIRSLTEAPILFLSARTDEAAVPVSYTHLWRTEPTSVEKAADELWVAEKFQSNPEIAGSPRNSFRTSLKLDTWR